MLHSHGRAALLEALIAIAPDHAALYAGEALHDCESTVRAIACRSAPADPAALDTLGDLSGDPLEDDDVRTNATQRLAHESRK
jgi:hypothetical protein